MEFGLRDVPGEQFSSHVKLEFHTPKKKNPSFITLITSSLSNWQV